MMLDYISRSVLTFNSRKISLALCSGIFLTAFCSVVFAATIKPGVKTSELSRHAWRHFSSGNKVEGMRKLHEINSLIAANPDLYTPNRKKTFSSMLQELEKSEKVNIKVYTPLIGQTLKLIDPIGKYDYLFSGVGIPKPRVGASPPDVLAQFASRASSNTLIYPTETVPVDVQHFREKFKQGTLYPQVTLLLEKLYWKGINPANHELLSKWESTPKSKRVFVTGSSSDHKYVQTYRDQAEVEGYRLFFYKDCLPLCSEAAVGALFATSSRWINIDSPGAEKSRYIPVELALIREQLKPKQLEPKQLGPGITMDIFDISEIDFRRPQGDVRVTRVYCPRYQSPYLNDVFGCLEDSPRNP